MEGSLLSSSLPEKYVREKRDISLCVKASCEGKVELVPWEEQFGAG